MRRFLLTSPNYSGEIELIYGDDAALVSIDFSKSSIRVFQKVYAMKRLAESVVLGDLEDAFSNSVAKIVEADFDISFDAFWNLYDQKYNRKRCETIWEKLSKADQVKAYYGVNSYIKHLNKNTWKSKADPDTYLRQRYWENEWK